MQLPWKEGHRELPSNYATCKTRLKSLLGRLRNEPEILREYDKVIREQLKAGVIERVYQSDEGGKVHYLPHQAVIRKEAETTKLRVMFDALSKEGKRGTSLNDCLHVGPPLTPLLYDILLRFRENRIGIVGDIKKAFLNIEVDEKDRDCLRFLWIEDPFDDNSRIVIFRFCRVVFGVNCSPFLLDGTLRTHLQKYKHDDPVFVAKILRSLYVDDLVSGGKNKEEVKGLYDHASKRLAEGGFKLRKWHTNDKEISRLISENESSKSDQNSANKEAESDSYAKETLGTQSQIKGHKVLGLEWDCDKDTLRFDLEKLSQTAVKLHPTKRNILSTLAGLFDPLGIISPITVSMKALFQELCVEKLGWDDELNEGHKERWDSWVKDLVKTKVITFNRCLYYNIQENVLASYLHGFGDASNLAYCAVVCFVYESGTGTYVKMLTSKTRVAPLKPLTIPRLELMSARILASLVDKVKKALEDQV